MNQLQHAVFSAAGSTAGVHPVMIKFAFTADCHMDSSIFKE
jgi:hypothetical protein